MIVELGKNPLRVIGHISISCADLHQPTIQFVLGNEPVTADTIWTTWGGTDMLISNNPIWLKFVPEDDEVDTPQKVKVDIRRIS